MSTRDQKINELYEEIAKCLEVQFISDINNTGVVKKVQRIKACDLCRQPDPSGSYRRIYLAPPPLPMEEGIPLNVCYNCYRRSKKSGKYQYPSKPEVILDEHDPVSSS